MSSVPFPTVDSARLDAGGWILKERTSETLFSLSAVRVEGHTLLYEQPEIRERVGESAEADLPWRFFFATRLTFDPPLAAGIGPRSVFPIVHSKARREFVADLEERGFEDVERERTRKIRPKSGDRGRLTEYTGRFVAGDVRAGIEAWFGVWIHEGEFILVGGSYPVSGLSTADLDPSTYREELLALLRNVE